MYLYLLNILFYIKFSIILFDSNILGSFISFVIISEYNKENIKYFVDDIFLLMMVPGLDFTRIFIERVIKGKSPFLGDKNHLHHIMLYKFGFLKTYLIITLFYISPIFLRYSNLISNIYIIIIFIIFYNFLYLYSKIPQSGK